MSFAVLLFFFGLLFVIFYSEAEKRFLALVIGTVLFPNVALFTTNPSISPQHIILYVYFLTEFFKDRENFNKSIFNNILTVPIALNIISYFFTAVYNSGITSKDMYYGIRDSIDCLGYIYAAYLCARHVGIKYFATKLIPFIYIICICGIVEIMLNDNIPYRLVCAAFPHYNGTFDLNSKVSLIENWRLRTFFTTKHPTAFGMLLMSLFLFYLPYLKDKSFERKKIILVLSFLAANIILCGSRTALVCALLGIALLIFDRVGPFLKIFIAGMIVFSFSALFSFMLDNFQTSHGGKGSSLDFRERQLVFTLLSISNSPILGNGNKYTSHVIFAEDTRAKDNHGDDLGGLESVVFSLLIDRGFFGLFSYYLLLVWMFILLFKHRKNPAISGGFALVAAGTAFVTLSGTIGNCSQFLFLLAGYQLGEIRKEQLEDQEDEENPSLDDATE
jgi:hypothetical protein